MGAWPGLRAWLRRASAGRRLVVAGAGGLAGLVLLTASPAGAIAITVPASATLPNAVTGTPTLSAHLGTVTVTAGGLVAPGFTATVSATVFKTGAGSANETIEKSSISYWSGPATSSSGLSSTQPGQLTALVAQDLSVARPAFSGTGLLLSISASWNPTIVVTLPSAVIAGTYSGTITHSAA